MKILELQKPNPPLDYRDFIKRRAAEADYTTLITEPTIGTYEGEIRFVYDIFNWDTTELVNALKTIKYSEGMRSRGLKSRSRIFGFRPRLAMRKDYCSTTSLAREYPAEHALICDFAKKIESIYQKYHPEGFLAHQEITEKKIKKSYRIGDSVFTSGIVNKNNPLNYHFDAGNFKKVYSCMPVFKKDIGGGHLVLPEFGVGIELVNNSIFMFDGQGIMHGVSPIKFLSPDAYRYSIVYYSLWNIWKCLEIDEELARIRNVKTTRERNRINPEHKAMLRSHQGKQ